MADTEPFDEILNDTNLKHEGEDPELAAACQQVTLRGLVFLVRHPDMEWHRTKRVRGSSSPKPLPPGKLVEIPPVYHEVPDRSDRSKIKTTGILKIWGHLPSPPNKRSQRRLRVEVWPHDATGDRRLTIGTGLAAIEIMPDRVIRETPHGDVPGRRADLNFVLGILSKIEDATLPKKNSPAA